MEQTKWISIVFMQGDDALTVLDMLDDTNAIKFLSQWDYGDENTLESLMNGYVYDVPGEGTNDRVTTYGVYALVTNTQLGYVSLLRQCVV